jgi:hypothetical protein
MAILQILLFVNLCEVRDFDVKFPSKNFDSGKFL